MKVLLWMVKNKAKNGYDPIYCRITINGERVEVNTGVNVKINSFCNRRKRIKRSSGCVENKNRQLEAICTKINDLFVKKGKHPYICYYSKTIRCR